MIELVIAAVIFIILAVVLLIYRVGGGPRVIDRVVASEAVETLVVVVMVLYAVYSGRGIYLDIAIVIALLGFVSTVLISRYLEGRL